MLLTNEQITEGFSREVERLKSELAKNTLARAEVAEADRDQWKSRSEQLERDYLAVCAGAKQLQDKAEAAEADTERLDWIITHWSGRGMWIGNDLREVADAAIAAQEERECNS